MDTVSILDTASGSWIQSQGLGYRVRILRVLDTVRILDKESGSWIKSQGLTGLVNRIRVLDTESGSWIQSQGLGYRVKVLDKELGS